MLSSSSSSDISSERDDDHGSISSPITGLTTPATSVSQVSLYPTKERYDSSSFAPFKQRTYYDGSVLPTIPKTGSIGILECDAQTPDNWIARDGRMIRLTGKHPYNVEAPLPTLFNCGFLTPQNLFYVRTHGDTPRVTLQKAREWKLRVHGLVEKEFEFTVECLKKEFPVVTLPITLVCAGNRRKEQNMVSKGLGFNWGAAGVSTGLFTGVYLADILEYCKPKNPLFSSYPSYSTVIPGRARHVIFEGADNLPKGKYGTSQRLSWAQDRSKGMIVAWGLNGEDLMPDHGYPLRLVVPGQIGGRMVKWLQRIEVSDRESQHHLHFFDNKLLPTEVTADQARNEDKWWHDPKYIINELNVNAAICSPAHDELLDLSKDARKSFPIEGYAYTGGGRRITRVEVTLNDGQTWNLADITYPEDLYRIYPVENHSYFGTLDLSMTEMSFAWCFWRLEIDMQLLRLSGSSVKVIAVRAMDEALSIMPRDMYWNAMSMMNSWWFRVAVHQESDGSNLRFEHPTLAGNTSGGWMERINDSGGNPRYPYFGLNSPLGVKSHTANPSDTTPSNSTGTLENIISLIVNPDKISTIITAAEFDKHSDGLSSSPWFVIHGHVFDGSEFLEGHPGGEQSIRLVAGEDATEDFMAIHSIDAKKMLQSFHVGKFEASSALMTLPGSVETEDDSSRPFLNARKWKKTRLVSRKNISHDSRIIRLALSHEEQELGLPPGQHVYLRVKKLNSATGEADIVQRAYTPYSGNAQRGFLDILIKVYFPSASLDSKLNEHFPGGNMTMILEHMASDGASEDSTSIELKGPIGHFTYLGSREVQLGTHVRKVNKLAMIAGGSGITPIWSTLKAIADEQVNSSSITPIEIWLVYGNRDERDILLRREIDELLCTVGVNLHLWHILSGKDVPDTWEMGRGHMNIDCLREHLPAAPRKDIALDESLALVCGPPAMEKAVSNALQNLGWNLEKDVVYF